MTRDEPDTDELVPGLGYRELVAAAMRHRTEASFRKSPFFCEHGAALERLLCTPRVEAPANVRDEVGREVPSARLAPDDRPKEGGVVGPAGPSRPGGLGLASIRVVAWNIEKGRNLDGILRRLRDDPWMRRADLLLLSEVDSGTARGGNLDQARRLANALGMHHAWLPTYVEFTKGTGVDLNATGENTLGLHGLAILSRWPVRAARAVPLPSCHDYFNFHEKRFGGRRGLYVLIAAPDRPFVAATTHLEVRRTPRCRARQFAAFLRGLEESRQAWASTTEFPGPAPAPTGAILGGDWNTCTFRRGNLVRSVGEFARIMTTPAKVLAAELLTPFAREPLFRLLAEAGFTLAPCNEAVATVSQDLGSVEDLAALPSPLARLVDRAFGLSRRKLTMRLDWIAVRDLEVAGPPVTLSAMDPSGHALSDHAAIGVDLAGG